MAMFGLGTLPTTLPLSWSGAWLRTWLQRRGWRTAAAPVILFAGLLTLAARWLMRISQLHPVLGALDCLPAHP